MNAIAEDKQTVHQQLKAALLEKIRAATINTRLPSERSLAEEFQVCRSSVNKVMDALEQEGYLSRRVGKGTFIAPRDKAVYKATDAGNMRGDVLIAYPDFFSYWIWEIVHNAEIHALHNNLNLINLKLQPESDFENMFKLIGSRKNLLGIMLMTPGNFLSRQRLHMLDQLGIPTVIIGSLEQARIYQNVYEVRNDHYKSGYIKMECLLRHGHRNIGLIPNEPASLASTEHVKGIKQALYDHGMRWKDMIQPATAISPWEDAMRNGYIQTHEVLTQASNLTALLCDTNSGAVGALRAIYERGLKCPDDISIITAMSNFNQEEFTCPKLTTVNTSAGENIATAMDIILNPGVSRGKSIIVDIKLFERESVRTVVEKSYCRNERSGKNCRQQVILV